MPLFDIRGEEVQIGDKVLCAVGKKDLRLGVFEKVSKASFVIRLSNKSAFSIARIIRVENPLWDYSAYKATWGTTKTYPIERVIEVENNKLNSSIIKVDKEFSL